VCLYVEGMSKHNAADLAYAEAHANAKLIAAAPELYDALLAIMKDPFGCRFCDSGKLRKPDDPEKTHDDDCGFFLARAAIAKVGS
jgi:hypothetical protein